VFRARCDLNHKMAVTATLCFPVVVASRRVRLLPFELSSAVGSENVAAKIQRMDKQCGVGEGLSADCWWEGLLSLGMGKRYKKGRPLWGNLGERKVGSSGGFAPRPPRFNALMPVRKLWKGKTGSVADPASVPAPESALGLLLSRALSSAQAEAIVAKRKRREKQWSEFSRRPSSGRLSRQTYGQPFNGSALNPEGSIA
jgi:hypothetical protein